MIMDDVFQGCYVVRPDGANELWIGDGKGKGFRIRASAAKGKLMLEIENFDGSPEIKSYVGRRKPVSSDSIQLIQD